MSGNSPAAVFSWGITMAPHSSILKPSELISSDEITEKQMEKDS